MTKSKPLINASVWRSHLDPLIFKLFLVSESIFQMNLQSP